MATLDGPADATADGPAYSATARLLHWITAIGVLTMIPAGIVMVQLEWGSTLKNNLYDYHRSVGAVLMVLIIVRIAYRLLYPPRPLPSDIPSWQHGIAKFVHVSLYALLLVNPFIGWVGTSAYPAKITVFWLFELPAIVEKNRPLSDFLLPIHGYLGLATAALVVLHLAGVFHHQFIRRDRILMRMVTG
ncbi:MAG: cytochrome b [Pseudomonadota bacterium]